MKKRASVAIEGNRIPFFQSQHRLFGTRWICAHSFLSSRTLFNQLSPWKYIDDSWLVIRNKRSNGLIPWKLNWFDCPKLIKVTLTWIWNDCLSACPETCYASVTCHASSCYPNESDYGCGCTNACDLCRGYATYCGNEIANACGLYFYFVICE